MLKSLWRNIRRNLGAHWPGVAVFIVAMSVGLMYLGGFAAASAHWGDPSGWFGAAAMLATGHGFGAPMDPVSVPGYEEFMFRTKPALDARALPDDIEIQAPSLDDEDRRYLLYLVAFTWWVMGVSWGALVVPIAFLYGVCALFVYGLFRLGIGRALSVLGTAIVMLSPGLLTILEYARDFSKAPFILGTLLAIGHLITGALSRRRYLALSAGVGLVIGIGFGFRQDLQICVLPAAVAIVFLARGEQPFLIRWRALALAIMLACFVVPASPVLKAMYRTHAKNSHYLLQGFAQNSTEELTFLGDSHYEACISDDDNLIHAVEIGYEWREKGYLNPLQVTAAAQAASRPFLEHAVRVLPFDVPRAVYSGLTGLLVALRIESVHETVYYFGPEVEVAGRKALLEVVKTFPGDVITRWYAAAFRVLHGVGLNIDAFAFDLDPFRTKMQALLKPLADHLNRFGLVYGLAAAVMLSAHNPWLAFVWSMLLLYFAGYTSLLFRLRHAFHLSFLPVWLALFVLDVPLRSAIGAIRRRFRGAEPDAVPRQRISLGLRVRRVSAYALAMLFCLAIPLYAARVCQRQAVAGLLDRYHEARLTRVDTIAEERDDWVIFRPRERLPMFRYTDELLPWDIAMEYLAVRLHGMRDVRHLRLAYEDGDLMSGSTIENRILSDDGTPLTHYFPVYEYGTKSNLPPQCDPTGSRPDEWVRKRFIGIAVPKDEASHFQALYRVENAVDFPQMISITIPQDRHKFRWYRPLLWPWQVPRGDAS